MTNRLSVFDRASSPPPLQLTQRDITIVSLVQELGFVTAAQVHKACFQTPGSRTNAEHRLKLLYQHGYLTRIPKPTIGIGSPKAIYALDTKGRNLLAEYRHTGKQDIPIERWDKSRSSFFLEHTLAVNELRITLSLATAQGHRLIAWITDRELRKQTMHDVVEDPLGGRIPIVPDGWGQIELPNGKTFSFFVELDRATEDRKQFQRKVRGYLAYWETGAYLKRYQRRSMTVLTVVSADSPEQEAKRITQLKEWTEGQSQHARGDTFRDLFWFAALSRVTPETVLTEPIWGIAGKQVQSPLLD